MPCKDSDILKRRQPTIPTSWFAQPIDLQLRPNIDSINSYDCVHRMDGIHGFHSPCSYDSGESHMAKVTDNTCSPARDLGVLRAPTFTVVVLRLWCLSRLLLASCRCTTLASGLPRLTRAELVCWALGDPKRRSFVCNAQHGRKCALCRALSIRLPFTCRLGTRIVLCGAQVS
jgi:hypothetical protein